MTNVIVPVVVVFGISSCGTYADKQRAQPPDASTRHVVYSSHIVEEAPPMRFPEDRIPEGGVAVLAGDCSGTLFKMDGMTADQKALVLTDGHCVGIGSFMGQYPADGEVLQDVPVDSQIVARKNKEDLGTPFQVHRILFASMTGTDLAIMELNTSYERLLRDGYSIHTAAKTVPTEGTILTFDSYHRMVKSTCNVETRVHQIKEGPWTWHGFLRLGAEPHCKFVHGQSGTAGVDGSSHLIYALAQTMYEGGEACSLNNPCEISPNGQKTVGKNGQPYAVPVAPLYDCFDSETKTFDFHRAKCGLGKAPPWGLSSHDNSGRNAASP